MHMVLVSREASRVLVIEDIYINLYIHRRTNFIVFSRSWWALRYSRLQNVVLFGGRREEDKQEDEEDEEEDEEDEED